MPIRTPTKTREISQLGLASGGSLAQGYSNYQLQMNELKAAQVADREQTAEAIKAHAKPDPVAQARILNAVGQINERDILTDEQARQMANYRRPAAQAPVRGPDQVPPNTLPAVVSRELIAEGGVIYPTWHVVRSLPGYLQEPIRVIGRRTLKSFTHTHIENIRINSTLSNAEQEVRALMTFIAQNGTYIRQPDKELMTFMGMFDIPNQEEYEAKVRLFQLEDQDFLLVSDNHGQYIYSWPSQDRAFDHEYLIEAGPRMGLLGR